MDVKVRFHTATVIGQKVYCSLGALAFFKFKSFVIAKSSWSSFSFTLGQVNSNKPVFLQENPAPDSK